MDSQDETLQPKDDGGAPTSVAITIQLVVLAVSFVVGRFLERIKFQWMGEAGAALLLGLAVGVILWGAGVGHSLAQAVAFKGDIFFYVLLPTIMFDAGYSLDTRMFIRNVGSVCLYAFAGTTISCFVIGLMMWQFGRNGWCLKMPLLANLTFGALISATDPVTVLAVFQRLNAQPDLYMNVFGESVLNDAVGLVLYQVLSQFLDGKELTTGSVLGGIGIFIGIFLGSAAIGIAVGLVAALLFRSRYFYSGPVSIKGSHPGSRGSAEHTASANSTFEVGLAIVFAYGSYLLADVAHCSGIVAVVVNGMVMNMYVRPNLSVEASHKIETLFKTLAGLFELFVFCYIGTTLFLQDEQFTIWGYTALALLALAVSRAANILPLTALVNLLRPAERHIGPKPQFVMWWSGLRGAMAFALAVQASEKYGTYGQVMKTCTFYLIFVTVLVNGGTIDFLLRKLHLRAEDSPALISHLTDSLADMHGFGSADLENAEAAEAVRGSGSSASSRGAREANNTDSDGYRARRPHGGVEKGGRSDPGVGGRGDEGGGGGGGGGGDQASELPSVSLGLADGRPGTGGSRSRTSRWLPGSRGNTNTSALRASSRSSSRLLAVPSALLDRVRSLNDGRLVARFDEFDRKISRVLIHPDVLRESELTSHVSFREDLAARQHGGQGAVGSVHGSHAAPQTLTLSPSASMAAVDRAADSGTAAVTSPVASPPGPSGGAEAGWISERSTHGGSVRSYTTATTTAAVAAAATMHDGGGAAARVSLGSIHIRPLTGSGVGSASSPPVSGALSRASNANSTIAPPPLQR